MTFNPDTLEDTVDWVNPVATTTSLASSSLPATSMAINTIATSSMAINPIPSSSVVPMEDLPASDFTIYSSTEDVPDSFLFTYETSFDNVDDNFHESEYAFTDVFNTEVVFWNSNVKAGSLWQAP